MFHKTNLLPYAFLLHIHIWIYIFTNNYIQLQILSFFVINWQHYKVNSVLLIWKIKTWDTVACQTTFSDLPLHTAYAFWTASRASGKRGSFVRFPWQRNTPHYLAVARRRRSVGRPPLPSRATRLHKQVKTIFARWVTTIAPLISLWYGW